MYANLEYNRLILIFITKANMLLYIHIPFCDSKCHYCSFNSYVDKFHLKQQYMQAALSQLKSDIMLYDVAKQSIETVFIGGGTPSTVEAQLYEPIFQYFKPYLTKNVEITTEANPNSASKQWLKDMFALGVNRVSFGTQSFNDKKLKFLNRAHSSKDAIVAIQNAKEVGIKNISLDLIYATHLDTKDMLQDDLDQAFRLPINHMSAYALTIEEGTVFQKMPNVANHKMELTQFLFEQISNHGFKQYEISNFGTYQSRHNLGYWQYKNYLGIGSGAVGCINGARYYPSKDIQQYINNPLHVDYENLSVSEQKDEKILLGLRSIVGVQTSLFTQHEMNRVSILIQEDKIFQKNDRIYNKNYLLSDELALFITT